MDIMKPVFTEKAECQDCYKCLRECPVKAIKIADGHAAIVPDMCIMCGHCVQACPVGAKRVRNDLERAKRLVTMKKRVVVSLAPSWASEFEELPAEKIIAAIRRLGFDAVSETALGAQEVSANVAAVLGKKPEGNVFISSACPTVVELIKKYRPEWSEAVTGMLSPLLAHCTMLRRELGEEIGIVFIGPCIAKKAEADAHPELLDVALTFDGLRRWWREKGIDPAEIEPTDDDAFVPREAEEGALYPIDGGMIAGVKAGCAVTDARFMTFSGAENVLGALDGLADIDAGGPVFLELLACEGGCVNGPRAACNTATAAKRLRVIDRGGRHGEHGPRTPTIDIATDWDIAPVERIEHSEQEIAGALARVGKTRPADELNCGSCGYDTCRQFAEALLDGRAEPSMCAGYMRKLAAKKADALLRTMPSGVAIVDETLRIVESNRRFAEILGEDVTTAWEASPGLEGARLEKVAPFHELFREVLDGERPVIEKDLKTAEAILHVSVFVIEPGRLAGAVMQDITAPAARKERIVGQARQVIERNLETVQQIAYLLGENAASSETILNDIIESFTPEEAGEE